MTWTIVMIVKFKRCKIYRFIRFWHCATNLPDTLKSIRRRRTKRELACYIEYISLILSFFFFWYFSLTLAHYSSTLQGVSLAFQQFKGVHNCPNVKLPAFVQCKKPQTSHKLRLVVVVFSPYFPLYTLR